MKRHALVIAAAAAGLLAVTPAEAKFRISLAVEPARPIARQPVRVTMRTEIVLPERHHMRLHVVGPGREGGDVTFFEPRLVRTGPRTYRATFRFPRAGRWRLIVPNWGAPGSASPPPVDRVVRVRPIS